LKSGAGPFFFFPCTSYSENLIKYIKNIALYFLQSLYIISLYFLQGGPVNALFNRRREEGGQANFSSPKRKKDRTLPEKVTGRDRKT
jgi:hypothetical protein